MNIPVPSFVSLIAALVIIAPVIFWGKKISLEQFFSHPLTKITSVTLASMLLAISWLGSVNDQNSLFILTVGLGSGMATAFLLIILNWDKLRSPFTVIVTYAINITTTLLVCHILGIGLGVSEEKAFVMLVTFVLINLLFFWQSFGMDPQVENPRDRKSYWLNLLWNFACIFYLVSFLVALVRHDIFIEELYVYHDLQLADEIGLQERINEKMSGYSNVGKQIREAGEKGNIAEIERLKKFAKETRANVNQLRKHLENPGWELFLKTLKPVFDLCGLAPSTYNWFFPDALTYLPGYHEITIGAGQAIPIVLDNNRDNHYRIENKDDVTITFQDGTKVLLPADKDVRFPRKGNQKFWIESKTKQRVKLIIT